MTTREVPVPPSVDSATIADIIEETIKTSGLRVAIRRSLSGYPNSQHWHLKRGQAIGTLELTWWPSRNRLWASVHANRAGAWALAEIESLSGALEDRLSR